MSIPPIVVDKAIYDIPTNNRLVKPLTLYERISKIFSKFFEKISSIFSRKPNATKLLNERCEQLAKENHNLHQHIRVLDQNISALWDHICMNATRIQNLEKSMHVIKQPL